MSKASPIGIVCTGLMCLSLAACGLQEKEYANGPAAPGAGGSIGSTGSGGSFSSGSGGSFGSGGNNNPVPDAGGGSMGSGGIAGDSGVPTGTGGTALGGASGNSIDINGMTVPQEKAIAFIHFGHSNMAGRGQAPTSLRPYFFTDVDAHAWMYHAGGSKAGFKPANEPFTAGDSTSLSGNSGGPGTPLVKQAAAMAPGYHFISVGFGQNALFCRNYKPGTSYYTNVMAGPKALKGKVTFAAIVIMLGITERHGTSADISGYPDCINTIVTQIRTELGLPNLPLLITDYEMTAKNLGEDLTPTGPFGTQIIPRIHAIPTFLSKVHPITYMPPNGKGAVTNSALVPTDGLALIDDHHFQLDSHKKWTQDLLDIMKEAGWFPWATQ
ncbi:MAG TPA: sialate O-acetylesterase [Polyangia bacterium]|nr:sialate O-acetylesterase [Polyangia bacterium]